MFMIGKRWYRAIAAAGHLLPRNEDMLDDSLWLFALSNLVVWSNFMNHLLIPISFLFWVTLQFFWVLIVSSGGIPYNGCHAITILIIFFSHHFYSGSAIIRRLCEFIEVLRNQRRPCTHRGQAGFFLGLASSYDRWNSFCWNRKRSSPCASTTS